MKVGIGATHQPRKAVNDMNDKATQARFSNKRHTLEWACKYGLTHFCDGTPNKSIDEYAKPKPVCPKYYRCEIREKSIYDKR